MMAYFSEVSMWYPFAEPSIPSFETDHWTLNYSNGIADEPYTLYGSTYYYTYSTVTRLDFHNYYYY